MISTNLDEETVLMSIEAGAYYGLEGPARSIWEALEKPITYSELLLQLTEEYQTTTETCAPDVEKFLQEMVREGLLRVE
jgi:hypothetical protein